MKFDEIEISALDLSVIDGDRGKNYPHKNELLLDGYCLFLSASNVTPNGFNFSNNVFITEEKDSILRNGKLSRNDIVITTRGTVGNVAIYNNSVSYDNVRINSGMLIIRCGDGIDNNFLYQVLRSKYFACQIGAMQTGSAQPQLPKSHFLKMHIPKVPLDKQRKISSILGSIDEKIQCNNEINKNLIEQAQAIYTDMFISKSNPVWNEGTLTDLVTVRYGKDHKKLDDGDYPVYGSGGIMRYVERPLYDKESVLIPRKGTLNNVMYVNEPFWSVDTMFYTEMKKANVAKFVYHFVKSKDLASLNAGSAVPSMTTAILDAMPLLIPDDTTLERFEKIVAPMYETIQHNTRETTNIATIRDTLIPHLMSGEIDISAIKI